MLFYATNHIFTSYLYEYDIYTNMKDSTIEQAYDLFISRFEDSLNDVFKNNRNTILFENANPEQELMDNVIQCIIYKMHTEYTLKKYEQE